MFRNSVLMLTATLLLAACSRPSFHDLTLEQMLAGHTKSEQRAMLKSLCLQEVERRPLDLLNGRYYNQEQSVPLLEQICKRMAQEMQPCDIVVQ